MLFNNVENKKYETINVDIKIENIKIKNTVNGHEIFINDFGCLLVPGKPILPLKIFSIAIPPETIFKGIDFEIKNSLTLQSFL